MLTSTTYVGCTRDLLVKPLQAGALWSVSDVFVAFSPERIDPGVEAHAQDSHPGWSAASRRPALHAPSRCCTTPPAAIHVVSVPEAAEMTKLLENTFRAVNIALANEFSDAAEELNVDVIEVIDAAATKPYGFMPFYPGPGWAGTASRVIRTTCCGSCGQAADGLPVIAHRDDRHRAAAPRDRVAGPDMLAEKAVPQAVRASWWSG